MKIRKEIGIAEIDKEIFEIYEQHRKGMINSVQRYIIDMNKLRDKLILEKLSTESLEEFSKLIKEELKNRKAEKNAEKTKELVQPVTESEIKGKRRNMGRKQSSSGNT